MKSSSGETILFEDADRDGLLITVAPFGAAGRVRFTISNHLGGASFTASDIVALRRALASESVQQAIARHLPRESAI